VLSLIGEHVFDNARSQSVSRIASLARRFDLEGVRRQAINVFQMVEETAPAV
jgi:hypothetical protein